MDQYKVGVKLAFSTNAMGLFPALSKELLGLDKQVAKLAKSWTGVGLAIKSAMAGFAAEKMLSGLTSIVEKTADLSHQLVQIQKLGQSPGDVAAANSAAISVTRGLRGITQPQALDIYSQLYSLVGAKEALQLLPKLSKFDIVMGNTTGDMGAAMSGSRDIVRAAEQMNRLTDKNGDVDIEKFQHFLDFATKVASVTHGAVNSGTWLNIAKMGGPALMNMDDRALGTVGILSQYMGGPRAGTSMMSMMQQFAGGTMFARSAQALQDIGELKEGEWSVKGGRVILNQEARQRLAKEFSDPLSAMENLIPKLKEHGYDTPDKMVNELFALFNRQTTQRAMADLLRNWGQIERELKRMESGLGVDPAYDDANKGDVKQNLVNLTTAYENFWYAVAGPNSENELSVLHSLTDFLGDFTKAIQGTNPAVVSAVGQSIVALTTGLAVFAGVGIVSAMVGIGAIPALVAGVVVALGALAVMNWDSIKNGLTMVGDKLAEWYHGFAANMATWLSKSGAEYATPEQLAHKFSLGEIGESLTGKKNTEELERNTKELKDLNDALKGVGMPIGYSGPGAGGDGARLINASYETVSRGLGGSASTGGGAGRGFGGSSSTGGSALSGPQIPAGVTGNAYVQALRAPFARELQDPNVRLQFMGMMLSEGGSTGQMPLADAESAMNRANFAGKTLMQMLHSGFYGPIKKGLLPSFMRRIQNDPALRARLNAYINQALGGSDIIHGHTDQGNLRLGDPGAAWENAHDRDRFGSEIFGDWLFGKGTAQWRQNFEARARGAVPPPPKSHEGEVHVHKLLVDGREVAHTAMKHIAKGGNSSASGGRMYDRSYTRPISI
jgi:hypothetical protein